MTCTPLPGKAEGEAPPEEFRGLLSCPYAIRLMEKDYWLETGSIEDVWYDEWRASPRPPGFRPARRRMTCFRFAASLAGVGKLVPEARRHLTWLFPPDQRCTRADWPRANASTSDNFAMVTSPGNVVSMAP